MRVSSSARVSLSAAWLKLSAEAVTFISIES